ncbi:transcriptional regulator [Streptomyces huasconensis]|uniref:transcriptional regulator n=1 Tax=Streptomyces huasconensis TaxID=1854574 RepID=UPI0034018D97
MFAAVFVALWVGHTIGDHWVQSSTQSAAKGKPGWAGRLADARHVIGLTLTKAVFLALTALVLDLHLTGTGLAAGLTLDAASHWWADRRSTLAWLAKTLHRSEFYNLGSATHPAHPTAVDGRPAAHLGTGAYALDQSFHVLFLFFAALIIATL